MILEEAAFVDEKMFYTGQLAEIDQVSLAGVFQKLWAQADSELFACFSCLLLL